ncbi:hypothetical protein QMM96_22285 [Citrobacter freundii]|uniref:hypothetical protein n=1 Tax=Citrobacter freundii TaxID=546 RepID=UPI002B24F387|nr:hypothetical protein [Citrobacter freundii]MEB2478161.1 hypothetical protein [Citrobacter freundii]
MQYIPTLNFLCTRKNGELCAQLIEVCRTPMSRKELGELFGAQVDSSKLSRVLFALLDSGLITRDTVTKKWLTLPAYTEAHALPFRIIPVDGVSAKILRLFGGQYQRSRKARSPAGGFQTATGPRACLTIKAMNIVLGVSREVLQIRLKHMTDIGILTRNTKHRPYSYEINVSDK